MKSEPGRYEERLAPMPASPWWGEIRSRYRLAAHFAHRLRVMDVGIGLGAGLRILKESDPELLVGIDNSLVAIQASTNRQEIPVATADACHLPFRSNSFDLVTSFEVVEHIPDASAALREIARVMRDDAVLLISTPNGERNPSGQPRNPFHYQEFSTQELAEVLRAHFSQVELFAQVTTDDYGPAPFWMTKADLIRLRGRSLRQVIIWGLLRLLPSRGQQVLSRKLLAREFHPTEKDFRFCTMREDLNPHVLVALCRK